jgi:hypothetical protein
MVFSVIIIARDFLDADFILTDGLSKSIVILTGLEPGEEPAVCVQRHRILRSRSCAPKRPPLLAFSRDRV